MDGKLFLRETIALLWTVPCEAHPAHCRVLKQDDSTIPSWLSAEALSTHLSERIPKTDKKAMESSHNSISKCSLLSHNACGNSYLLTQTKMILCMYVCMWLSEFRRVASLSWPHQTDNWNPQRLHPLSRAQGDGGHNSKTKGGPGLWQLIHQPDSPDPVWIPGCCECYGAQKNITAKLVNSPCSSVAPIPSHLFTTWTPNFSSSL